MLARGIVSRILLKQPSGSVTAFAFDAGQELSEHTCPFDALLQVLEGEAAVMIGGTAYHVASPQMIRFPAHVPHAVKAPRQFKMSLLQGCTFRSAGAWPSTPRWFARKGPTRVGEIARCDERIWEVSFGHID
jgi:hypothetical protein